MSDPIKLREDWLNRLAKAMAPKFKSLGHELPSYRVSCGFPSTGRKSKRIGECWSSLCSKDSHFEIFIHPSEDDPMTVVAILAHELIHAAVGLDQKHGGNFKKVALAIGLTGKMTATVAGAEFEAYIEPLLKKVGPYPHSSLSSNGASSKGPKQSTRLTKVCCADCGYIARVTNKWIESVGAPICPCNNEPMTVC